MKGGHHHGRFFIVGLVQNNCIYIRIALGLNEKATHSIKSVSSVLLC